MKIGKKSPKVTDIKTFQRFRWSLVIILITIITTALGLNAYAGDTLIHGSTLKQTAEKFVNKSQDLQLSKDPGSCHQELMPVRARPVKDREEVNKLLAQISGSSSGFVYDPFGRLARITESDGSVRQFIFIGSKMAEERDGTGAVTKRFFDWGQMIGNTKYFYNRDHLGSVREMLDISGNVVASYAYDSFGQVVKLSGSGADSDFLYAGYFYHRPSKLYVTAHRVYSPKLARWLSRDPIDDPTFAMMPVLPDAFDSRTRTFESNEYSANTTNVDPMIRRELLAIMPQMKRLAQNRESNLYTYVRNNPLNFKDPSGLTACPPRGVDDDGWSFCEKLCKKWEKDALQWILCMERCMAGK
jgi:RHS repeat-associated protein